MTSNPYPASDKIVLPRKAVEKRNNDKNK